MEATVTMPLIWYEDNKSRITNLRTMIENKNKEIEELLALTVDQNQLISTLQDFVLDYACKYSSFERESLDSLIKPQEYNPHVLKGFYSWKVENLEKYGITLDIQRDFITRKYNEYQEKKQQEELENGSK